MALDRNDFRSFITGFQFRELFNEMGWDNDRTKFTARIDEASYELESVGKKSGFSVFVCSPDAEGHVPDATTRKKVETQVRRRFQEHLIIFRDAANSLQIWQWVSKRKDRPSKVNETRWKTGQDPEILFQKTSGIYFELHEEGNITIVDVTAKVAANFDQNNERVTKRFYEVFKKNHKVFYDFVSGIDDHIDEWNRTHKKDPRDNRNKQWYVSLMLNRLMFCYFIQKKGFLDKNHNYLKQKLGECREKQGKNKYYSFYRDFLLALFHEGLGNPQHDEELKAEIGRIPYLNGGLFDTHELEREFAEIEVDDEAFEKVFDFFDQYNWHLDDTDNGTGRDVNPDVIGYIFEKYINERSAMGAYYTKEDITDYISKNCILPFLFDETKRHYPKAFKTGGEIWSNLKNSGDTYIYDAVKHGIDVPYPPEIETGLDTTTPGLLERRKHWNKKAPAEAALPTEIWREVVDRRRRQSAARSKIGNGEITEINDFIACNLDIRQFVLDCVQNTEDPKFLEHFYKSIAGHTPGQGTNEKPRNPISILDPTCGSGAFLFAALNILEELYSACIQRMEDFIENEDRSNSEDKANFKNQYSYFRRILSHIKDGSHHPNRQYFIYKSIILNNLYGVDIMREAVEIAKLRLFLKLVATVDADYRKPNLGLEPLPDIDFNIRAGNTLVGIANLDELDTLFTQNLDFGSSREVIDERMEIISRTFARFKNVQTTTSVFATVKGVKQELYDRLAELNAELDDLYHEHSSSDDFDSWRESHQPFHWIAEYYEIIHDRGGFDAIIGNPPYVEYKRGNVKYEVSGYDTLRCGNLFAFVMERCLKLLKQGGRDGLIVLIGSLCTERMAPLQDVYSQTGGQLFLSSYSGHTCPGVLFEGVANRYAIWLLAKSEVAHCLLSSKYMKWYSAERPFVFQTIQYGSVGRFATATAPKHFDELSGSIYTKITGGGRRFGAELSRNGESIYLYTTPIHWMKAFTFVPFFRSGTRVMSGQLKEVRLRPGFSDLATAALNSSTFFFWWILRSDCYHLTSREIENFLIPVDVDVIKVRSLTEALMSDFNQKSTTGQRNQTTTGLVEFQVIDPKLSKAIIDDIDLLLATHYGFTDEELDFITNYDIKYRMGSKLDSDEE